LLVSQRGRHSRRTHDVAIYSPDAALFYGSPAAQLGGAELQTTFLARELARRGLRVAHIVYPVNPRPLEQPAPTLVERSPWQEHRYRRMGELAEAAAIWRSFRRADAEAYIVRGSGGQVPAAAGFCRTFGRRFVFSTSSELDFDFERPDRFSHVLRVYRASIPMADRVVVQTDSQRQLAERTLPTVRPAVIPSFAEAAEPAAEGEHFLWANRLVEYKLPERYLELAAALPEARFKMIMGTTSETPAGLIEQTRAAAAELPNLELLPARPRQELLADMHTATAVVTTSRIEGMPNTFLEAWARGVPVLSLHVDPDDKIANHDLGTVAGGSMERLIEAAAALWRDPGLREEIGERARRFVRETHWPEAVGDRWAELLGEILRGGAQRPK
jgi:glycosyltransferase involved in cell wall biosynthesis